MFYFDTIFPKIYNNMNYKKFKSKLSKVNSYTIY